MQRLLSYRTFNVGRKLFLSILSSHTSVHSSDTCSNRLSNRCTLKCSCSPCYGAFIMLLVHSNCTASDFGAKAFTAFSMSLNLCSLLSPNNSALIYQCIGMNSSITSNGLYNGGGLDRYRRIAPYLTPLRKHLAVLCEVHLKILNRNPCNKLSSSS